jgi:hypothetical protein
MGQSVRHLQPKGMCVAADFVRGYLMFIELQRSRTLVTWNQKPVREAIRDEFEELVRFVCGLRLGTREEGVHRSGPTEFDPEIGLDVPHPQQIHYRRAYDFEQVEEQLVYAKSLIPPLAEMFEKADNGLEFQYLWGRFNHACGYLSACYFSKDDLGEERRRESNQKTVKKRWISRLLLGQLEQVLRKAADWNVAQGIKQFIERGDFPPGFGREWFEDLILEDSNNKARLVTTYDYDHLSESKIRKFAGEPVDGQPPLIPIPTL